MVESFERHCRAVQLGAGWKAVEDAVRTGREAKRGEFSYISGGVDTSDHDTSSALILALNGGDRVS